MVLNTPKQSFSIPAIAQLVEHLTVDSADIRWSLVRFRVAGFMGMGDTFDRNFFKKRCWVTRLPTHVLLSAPARRLGRHGAAHCLEKATHMQCTRPKIEKIWEHHCLSVLLLLWSD